MYTRDSVVTVHPFTRQPDKTDVIIGKAETGVFLAVPPEAVELLDELATGKTVGEAADLYYQKYGETPDLEDFLASLEAKGIVKSHNESCAEGNIRPAKLLTAAQQYHFAWFPQSVAAHIFSTKAVAVYLATVLFASIIMIGDPWLVPNRSDFYFPNRRIVTWAILTLASYLTIFFHELAHLIAARAVGVSSRMGLSNRLWYLVAETDLTGLWALPKRSRYLPMLAGMILDGVSGALFIMLLAAYRHGWIDLPFFGIRLARGMIFSYVLRIMWQMFLFVRTDLYFVIANFFDCRNLLKDTQNFLRNILARLFQNFKPVDQSSIPKKERVVIAAYSVLWVLGRIMAFGILFLVTIPILWRYAVNIYAVLSAGFSAGAANYIDALVFSITPLVPIALGFAFWINSMIRGERTKA